jgi:hypothetical protein
MKILISDTDQSHANSLVSEIQTFCPSANIVIRIEDIDSSVTWAASNGVNIIARPTTGLNDARIAGAGVNASNAGIGIVHGHGSNSHVLLSDPSYIGEICAVGYGNSTPTNLGSYGPGLEFFDNTSNESKATARVAGMIGQLMINHLGWTFDNARSALRQSASNWDSGFVNDGGYGLVDFDVADTIEILPSPLVLGTLIAVKSLIEVAVANKQYISSTISHKKTILTSPYTDAQALIARMNPAPSSSRQELITNLIESLQDAGVWDLLDIFYVFAAHAQQAALLNWIKAEHNITAVNSPTFTTDRGFQGNGSTSYLNTNYVAATNAINYALNDASIGIYSRTDSELLSREDCGTLSADFSKETLIQIRDSINGFYGTVNGISLPILQPNPTSLGFFSISRLSSIIIRGYKNGAQIGTDKPSLSDEIPQVNMFICALNYEDGAIEFSNRQYSTFYMGGTLSDAQHLSFFTALETYLDAVGAGVVS